MYFIIGNSQTDVGVSIGNWYAQQVKKNLYAPYGAIGFLDKQGNIKGAAILDAYNGANVNIHIYGPRCMTRTNIGIVFNYVFNELKCIRMTAIIERSNKRLLKTIPRMDFKFEAILKEYFGPEKKNDGILYRIGPIEALKWIKNG